MLIGGLTMEDFDKGLYKGVYSKPISRSLKPLKISPKLGDYDETSRYGAAVLRLITPEQGFKR